MSKLQEFEQVCVLIYEMNRFSSVVVRSVVKQRLIVKYPVRFFSAEISNQPNAPKLDENVKKVPDEPLILGFKKSLFKEHLSGFGVGCVAGCIGSMVGLGGGFIMIPMLTAFNKLTQRQASATSLAAVIATGCSGAISYAMAGQIDFPAAVAIGCTAMLTAGFGAKFTGNFNNNTMKKLFGILCILLAPTVPLKQYLLNKQEKKRKEDEAAGITKDKETKKESYVKTNPVTTLATGGVVGFTAGFFGVGGGGLITPAFCLTTDWGQQKVLGTSLAALVFPALAGSFTHYKLGNIVMKLVPSLFVGAAIGSFIGSHIARHCPDKELKYLFAVVMAFSGVKMII